MRIAALAVTLWSCGYDWTVQDAPCTSNKDCKGNTYCVFPDRQCGKRASGTCKRVPPTTECQDIDIVCGCNGDSYKSPCLASAVSQDLSILTCQPLDGYMQCGSSFCANGTSCVGSGVDARCGK